MGDRIGKMVGEEDIRKQNEITVNYDFRPDLRDVFPLSTGHKRKFDGQLFLLKKYEMKNWEEAQSFGETLKMRRSLSTKFLPRLEDVFFSEQQGYCQTFIHCNVLFEFAEYSLEKEIQTRASGVKGPVQNFTESEVWYMLHTIVSALVELHGAGYSHGDIQPKHIMIDTGGNIKLADFMCYDASRFHASPIAPELMSQYIQKVPMNNYSQQKADIFSLGITLLSICTLADYRVAFYSFQDYRIQDKNIQAEKYNVDSVIFD